MENKWYAKLYNTTLTSCQLTHCRLKYLASMAETSEDHISRIGMGLSLKEGAVRQDWRPSQLGVEEVPMTTISGKSIRGKTLFKDDLSLFCALILQHQVPEDYDMWRLILSKHWERGVQLLYQRAIGQKEWLIVITNLLDIS